MSLEGFETQKKSDDSPSPEQENVLSIGEMVEQKIEELSKTGSEGRKLADMWEERIADMDEGQLEKTVQTIDNIIEVRTLPERSSEHIVSELKNEGVEIREKCPPILKEQIERIRREGLELGCGKAACVFVSDTGHEVCYKVLHNQPLPRGGNSLAAEILVHHKIWKDVERGKVSVPEVFYFVTDRKTEAFAMETLNAVSIRDIKEGKEDTPESFDSGIFFNEAKAYLERMHAAGYYHRDLNLGNIMMHRETGLPCVIDFGFTRHSLDESSVYRQILPNNDVIDFADDFGRLERAKRELGV